MGTYGLQQVVLQNTPCNYWINKTPTNIYIYIYIYIRHLTTGWITIASVKNWILEQQYLAKFLTTWQATYCMPFSSMIMKLVYPYKLQIYRSVGPDISPPCIYETHHITFKWHFVITVIYGITLASNTYAYLRKFEISSLLVNRFPVNRCRR